MKSNNPQLGYSDLVSENLDAVCHLVLIGSGFSQFSSRQCSRVSNFNKSLNVRQSYWSLNKNSQPSMQVICHKPSGRLLLVSTRPTVLFLATELCHRSPKCFVSNFTAWWQMQKCANNLMTVAARKWNGPQAKLSPINCNATMSCSIIALTQCSSAIKLKETSFSEGLIATFLNSTEQFSAFHTATEKMAPYLQHVN